MFDRRLGAAVVTVLALAAGTVHARGQLQAKQTLVELAANVRAGRLVLANSGDAPLAAQIRVFAWTQDGQDDQLTPSNELTPSPVIVEIPAGGEQLVRLVRPSAVAPAREQAFRVVVDELPGDASESPAAVAVRMRYLIPAFIRVPDAAPVALHCRLESASLACENTGGRAAQLGATRIVDRAGHRIEVTPGLLGYVLAGSSRRWPLDAAKLKTVGAGTKLEVRLNGEPATIDLPRTP